MSLPYIIIDLPRGSVFDFEFEWLDEDDNAINLTGWDVQIFDVEPAALAPFFVVEKTGNTPGKTSIVCPWNDSWPDGTGALVSFRHGIIGSLAMPQFRINLI